MNATIALLAALAPGLAAEPAAYPSSATVELPAAEMLRLDLSPAWTARCPDPNSYLLLDASGQEVPFAVRTSDEGAGWRAEPLRWEPVPDGHSWTARVQKPKTGEPVHALRLAELPRGAVAEVSIARADGRGPTSRHVVWNLPDTGAGVQLEAELPAGLDDGPWLVRVEHEEGVGWRRVSRDLGFVAVIAQPWSVLPVTMVVEPEGPVPSSEITSDWLLRLPRVGLPLRRIEFEVADPLFSRPVQLMTAAEADRPYAIGNGTLERMAHGEVRIERTSILLDAEPPADVLLRVQDGRSPPLDIEGVELSLRGVALVVPSTQAGPHVLLGCGPSAASYDLERLDDRLAEGRPTQVTTPDPGPHPGWQPSSAGAGLLEPGPTLDLAGFRFSRTIHGSPGLVRLALDDHVLAHRRHRSEDLRFLDDQGRQLPYLLREAPMGRVLEGIEMEREEVEGESLLHLELPWKNMYARTIVLRTQRTHFERNVRLAAGGSAAAQAIASQTWLGADEGESRLVIELHRLLPRSLDLHIDNGDNLPLQVDSVQLIVPAIEARLALPAGGSAQLVYGHADIAAPRYDLELLRERVLTQPVEPATMADVEELAPPPAEPPRRGLLLGAIALLAALLLGLTVRLLRTPEEA